MMGVASCVLFVVRTVLLGDCCLLLAGCCALLFVVCELFVSWLLCVLFIV